MTLEQIALTIFISGSLLVLDIHRIRSKDSLEISHRMNKITAKTFRQRLAQTDSEQTHKEGRRGILNPFSSINRNRVV